MLKICLQYIPVNLDVAFLRIKQSVIDKPHYQLAFFTHVYSSMFALIAGFTQFSNQIKRNFKAIHKGMGYVYFVSILVFCAPSGLIMAYYANGGWSSQVAFGVLSVLWWTTTFLALVKVVKKDFGMHQYFIYISYALTLSALTLRIWKFLLVYFFEPNPLDLYRIVAWLGWVPNLIIAILLINFKQRKNDKNKIVPF